MKKMRLEFSNEKDGVSVRFKKKKFSLKYPNDIWKRYPYKDVLFDNIAYLLSICVPLVARAKEVNYNTGFPLIKKDIDKIVIENLRGVTEEYKREKPSELIKNFKEIKYNFNGGVKQPDYKLNPDERANVALSCGKDSLLSLGVCHEIGLNPVITYINDTVSPTENRIKLDFFKKIAKELKLDNNIVTNQVEKLNDFEFWNKPETCIGYSHLLSSFCLLSLPICYDYNAKYTVLGNEQDMEFQFVNKEGEKVYASFEQSIEGMKVLNKMVSGFGDHQVISVIKPLVDIALVKVLHKRYSNLGKYQVSCPCLDATNNPRWCQEDSTCTLQYLFYKAHGIDVKKNGFSKNLFDKKYKDYFALFNGKKVDVYNRNEEAKEQDLIAFYLAYKNKAKGYLVDLFKKKFLDEAKEKEDLLYKKFFKIYPSSMPSKIKQEVVSIYKEELNL